MLAWKIKSQFKLLESSKNHGLIFLVALFLAILSLLMFQRLDLVVQISLIVGLIYIVLLLQRKYQIQLLLILLSVFLVLAGKKIVNFSYQVKPEQNNIYLVKPSDIKIVDDFAFGTAKNKNHQVSFSLKPTNELRALVENGQLFYLRPTKMEFDLVKQATNPAEFDLRNFYKNKGIKYQLEIQKYDIVAKRFSIFDGLEKLRFRLKKYFMSLPSNLSFFAGQLFLGEDLTKDNTKLPDIKAAYRNLGVIHLLCISGLHVILYTRIIDFFGSVLRLRQKYQVFVKVVVLLLLVYLSNFQPGILRAVISFFIALFLKKNKLALAKIDRFGLVFLIHVLIVPNLLTNVGAQLSYLLVLGLTIIGNKSYWLKNIWLNLIIMPILVFNFYEINLLTVFYNFLIVPIFNFIILPATFFGLISSVFSTERNLFTTLTNFFEVILRFVNSSIGTLGEQKIGLILIGQIKPITCLLLSVIIFAWISFYLKNRKSPWLRKLLIAGILLFSLNLSLIKFSPFGAVNFIDIGQGDSILITTPFNKKSFLIDTGGKLAFSKKKSKANVEKITIPFLKSQGIRKLNGVFLTHQDADHLGDLSDLLAKFPVEKIYFGAGMQYNLNFQKKIRSHLKKVTLVPISAGQEMNTQGLRLKCLYPNYKSAGKNEDSLTLLASLGNKNWLFSGDLDQAGEEKILKLYPNLVIDYFKLGHHGSRTSTSKKLVTQLHPKVGIISAGRKNRYGHPHLEVLQLLEKHQVRFLNTADYGMISWYYSNKDALGFKTYLRG